MCSSRFHQAGCGTVTAAAAATGSAEAVEAWRDVLDGYTSPGGIDASSIGLANRPELGDGLDAWSDLLSGPGGPGSADPELHARMLAALGEADAGPAADPAQELPDVSAVREALGL